MGVMKVVCWVLDQAVDQVTRGIVNLICQYLDGSDPDGWISRVERIFCILQVVGGGDARSCSDGVRRRRCWYQWELKWHPIKLWVDLKQFILRQFRHSNGGSLYEQWLATTQVG